MRRAILLSAFAGSMAASTLSAAAVSFDPPEVFIDPPIDSTVIEFAVTLHSDDGHDIQRFEFVLASDDLALTSFDYTQAINENASFTTPPGRLGLFANDLIIGAFFPVGTPSPLLLGVLTVDAVGLSPGTYTVFTDPGCFECQGPLGDEAFVHVIPEPGSVLFFLFGVLVTLTLRRRRSMPPCWSRSCL